MLESRSRFAVVAASISLAFGAGAGSATAATFNYTGTEQTYDVPINAATLQITAIGGRGGSGQTGGTGGDGAMVTATVPVTAGQTLYVLVGANGGTAAGFNGGGAGGGIGNPGVGGAGGGASDVRTCSIAAVCPALGSPGDPRLLVAAGGGGGGGDAIGSGAGGGDAGATAQAGGDAADLGDAGGGDGGGGASGATGGLLGAGGFGGYPSGVDGTAGAAGQGGDGGDNGASGSGGGGGGGYAGGGGGSSFVVPVATGVTVGTDTSGTPSITITVASTIPVAPASITPPSIDGDVVIGGTLSCQPGIWTESPSFSFAWLRDGVEVGTGASYTLAAADGGHVIQCQVTADSSGLVRYALSPAVFVPGQPIADTTPPVTIPYAARERFRRTARFRFTSTELGSTFECRLDRDEFDPCTSPVKLKRLKRGRHRFRVRATDPAGNTEAGAVVWTFRVMKRH